MISHSPSSEFLRIGAAILIAAIVEIAPGETCATPITSAANIPYSGISPGGVNMATGELILVMRPDLRLEGPMPVEYGRYYGSMIAREGFAVGHHGLNWLGTYDWGLSQSPVSGNVDVVTNRGRRIQFQQMPGGGFTLIQPTDQQYRLDAVGANLRFTHPGQRRVYLFDLSTLHLSQILDERGNSLHLSYTGGFLTQVTDGLGRAITLGYDPSGHVTQASDGTRTVGYGYVGNVLTTVTDAAGHPWMHTINPGPIQGLLAGITEPLSNTPITQTYDPSGRVSSQLDAAGGAALYAYDAPTGSVFTDPLGHPWIYHHDPANRLQSLTDPMSETTSFGYDPLGRLASVMRPLGDATSIGYDPASGYAGSITLGDGSLFTWGYSSHAVGGSGGPTMFDLATANFPDGTTETYGRDPAGNLTDFMDRGGFPWHGTYNLRGQPLTFTNPTLGITTFTYDTQGRLTTAQDNATNTTQFGYDGLGRVTQITWPNATGRQYTYDALDRRTSLTDERGKVWGHGYDANGRLVSATNPLLEATSWVYDLLDRVTQVVDPLGHAHVYAYDAAGRTSSATDRSGRTTTYEYDTVGRLTGAVDPAGGTDTYAYDGNSRMVSRQDPLGHVTLIGHDALDLVTSVTDPVGSEVSYDYDNMGRLTSTTAPLGHTETFSYDPRGLLTSFANVSSVTGWSRTPLGVASQVTDPNGNGWPRSHDPQGRLTNAADPLARTTGYEYDALSRPTQITRPDGSIAQLAYDDAGRVTGASYSGGPTLVYGYDDANRLTSATGASFTYDAAGRMTGSNGITMTFDGAGRLLSETLAPGKVVTYAYDTRGLLSQVIDWLGGTTSFTYDTDRRLTGMTRPNGTTGQYAYDAADRLISSVERQPGPMQIPISSITITRDALGHATSIERRQPLMPGGTTPMSTALSYDPASQVNGVGHDPLGRTTSEGARAFQWDGASRLTRYAAGADSPQFTYDAFGQPLTRTLGTQTGQFVWNFIDGVPVTGVVSGAPSGPRDPHYYVRMPATGVLLYSVDGPAGARHFYHYDEAGNAIFLTNDVGSVVTEYAYTPFGGVTALGETSDNPFTFGAARGMIALGSSGLFRLGSEIYDAQTMRVISGNTTGSGPVEKNPGPIGIEGYQVQGYQVQGYQVQGYQVQGYQVQGYQVQGYQVQGIVGKDPGPCSMVLAGFGEVEAGVSGIAEVGGNDWMISLGPLHVIAPAVASKDRLYRMAGTLMHEVGHSIDPNHGDNGSFDPKRPYSKRYAVFGHGAHCVNEVSIMNYRYQSSGIPIPDGDSDTPSNPSVILGEHAGALIHEIGHSVDLCHGGASDNLPDPQETGRLDYSHQPAGVDLNCDGLLEGGDDGIVSDWPLLPPSPISLSEPAMKRPPRNSEGVKYGVWLPVFSPGSPCTWCVQ